MGLTAFEKVPGLERASASITFKPGRAADALQREVAAHPDVRLAQYMDTNRTQVDGVDAAVVVIAHLAGLLFTRRIRQISAYALVTE